MRRAEKAPEQCLEPLSQEHPYNCQAGCARFRPHRHVLITWADCLREKGVFVDVERFCPDLCKPLPDGSQKEAWLDVVAQWPGAGLVERFDVTIRSTWADYANAGVNPGAPANAGVKAKGTRYGQSVHPISFEPLGRLARVSLDIL